MAKEIDYDGEEIARVKQGAGAIRARWLGKTIVLDGYDPDNEITLYVGMPIEDGGTNGVIEFAEAILKAAKHGPYAEPTTAATNEDVDTEAIEVESPYIEPTDRQIKAFQLAWEVADGLGLKGQRTRAGLIAALREGNH